MLHSKPIFGPHPVWLEEKAQQVSNTGVTNQVVYFRISDDLSEPTPPALHIASERNMRIDNPENSYGE